MTYASSVRIARRGLSAAALVVLVAAGSGCNKLKARDLLFIHTNNHGDNSGGQSFLCAFPNWGEYWANDFCTDLKTLPKYKSLIVMMEQCNAGGFNLPVLAARAIGRVAGSLAAK